MNLIIKIKNTNLVKVFLAISGSISIAVSKISIAYAASTPVAGSKNAIFDLIQTIINLIFGITGFVIIGMIILGGIQYSTSGGNPQAASGAKKKINNAILALLLMVFLYPFLQWIVPGGIFG